MILEALKHLLTKNDCVILPEFGGFIAQRNVSMLHPVKNTITPPSKRIVFNSALSGNDGLLLNYLSNEFNLSAEEASVKVSSYVKGLYQDLKSKSRASLDGLGIFSLNAEGKPVFVPEANQDNFLEESFGLPTIYIKPLEKSVFMENKEKRDLQNTPQEEKSSNKSKMMIIIPVILVLIGVGVAIFFTNKDHPVHQEASVMSTDSMENETTNEDEILGDVDNEDETSGLGSTEESTNSWASEENEEVTTSTHSSGPYFIIAGVFSKEKNAEQFVSGHYGAKTMEVEGLYKVSVASYGNVDDALEALPQLRSQYGSEVWIMKHH